MGGVGFFGKLPCNGDFLTKRLPRSLIQTWDAWIRLSMAETRRTLGESAWNDRYLLAPMWRFFWSAGIIGDLSWTGVFMPSVDSGGRQYPMLVATPLGNEYWPPSSVTTAANWYQRLEEIMLSSLEPDIDISDFDHLLATTSALSDGAVSFPTLAEVESDEQLIEDLRRLLNTRPADASAKTALWWTVQLPAGCERCFVSEGFPATDGFERFVPATEGIDWPA